jgi:hypothetical protein
MSASSQQLFAGPSNETGWAEWTQVHEGDGGTTFTSSPEAVGACFFSCKKESEQPSSRPLACSEGSGGVGSWTYLSQPDEVPGVAFDARDKPRMERMCRYLAWPPIAQDRHSLRDDASVQYTMKRT